LADRGDACDLTIFDTAPTGHTLRLVSLPETMAAWTEGLLGARRRTESVTRAFRGLVGRDEPDSGDARRARLAGALERRRRLFSGAREVLCDPARTAFVLVLIPERLPLEETARAIDALERIGIEPAALVVNQVLPELEEGDFFGARRRIQQRWLDEIGRRFGGLDRLELPLLADEVSRSAGLEALVDELHAAANL
ncbi:MAG: TRC40/GET3/ArsA family transport-energizing ATPase, partial [Wenzhouxiangellaceae bacterium]|nr:TRC40/GET3/ArsA family transport-energizing ATPase [Wenzhouxiangellaceae bacterium]